MVPSHLSLRPDSFWLVGIVLRLTRRLDLLALLIVSFAFWAQLRVLPLLLPELGLLGTSKYFGNFQELCFVLLLVRENEAVKYVLEG